MKHLYFFMTTFVLCIGLQAQNGAEVDPNFNTGSGFNDYTYPVVEQPDGKILIGGSFTSYDDTAANRIIRLNGNGSIDTSFDSGTGFDNFVFALALQDDGKIIVGGFFTSYNGAPVSNLVRLNSNGSLDTSFDSGSGFNDVPLVAAIQEDGKIIVGGYFTSYNGTESNEIIRLNPNGSIDSSFDIGEGFTTGSQHGVYSISLQPDGKIIASGVFVEYDDEFSQGIVRINPNGSRDESFSVVGTGTGCDGNGLIYTNALQPDGKTLTGGTFDQFACNDVPDNINRINNDGSVDDTFSGAGMGITDNYEVYALAVQNDGKILAGGRFYEFNGSEQSHLVRLNTDGSKDTSFDIGTGFDWVNGVGIRTIKVLQDGRILVAGDFSTYNGETHNNIICLKGTSELGTDNPEAKNVQVYPNPVNDFLIIKNPDLEFIQLEIADMNGRVIHTQKTDLTEIKIDFKNYNKGIYLVRLKSKDNQAVTKKIVKN